MFDRHYIKFLIAVVVVATGVSFVLLFSGQSNKGSEADKRVARAMEMEIAYQARVDFLTNLLQPVRQLHQDAKSQTALLELDKILKDYPGEGHVLALKAEILFSLDALSESIAVMVAAVRKEGDLVDEAGLLSRRTLVESIVEAGETDILPQLVIHADNRSLQLQAKKIYYLQSRLAGGCE